MRAKGPMTSNDGKKTNAVATKIIQLVEAEDRRLIESGVDRTSVDAILVNGTVLALASIYRKTGIGDDQGLGRGAARLSEDAARVCELLRSRQASIALLRSLTRLWNAYPAGR